MARSNLPPPVAPTIPDPRPDVDKLLLPSNAIEKSNLSPRPASRPAREQRVAETAYRLAEQRGFAPGGELEDWLAAERRVDEDDAHLT